MGVDPTKPGSSYRGSDFQEWQRERRKLISPPPPPRPPSTSSIRNAPPTSYPGGRSVGSSPAAPGGDGSGAVGEGAGLGAALAEHSAKLALGVVNRIGPLKACVALGERLIGVRPKVRFFIAIPCGLLAAGIAAGAGAGGKGIVVLLALAFGGVIGWQLPTLLALVLTLGAHLTGLAIGLGLIGLAVALIYAVIRAIAH